jgi:hypothetical protein
MNMHARFIAIIAGMLISLMLMRTGITAVHVHETSWIYTTEHGAFSSSDEDCAVCHLAAVSAIIIASVLVAAGLTAIEEVAFFEQRPPAVSVKRREARAPPRYF